MDKVIGGIFALISFIITCIIIGGFGLGSIVWLVGLFFNSGWSYLGVVRVAAVIFMIFCGIGILSES